MALDFFLPLRALKLLLALIILGLTGYAAHFYDNINYFSTSPSQVNFLIFLSIWTILVIIFLTVIPRFAPSLAHGFILLAVEALTMLFWFAGFIALAVLVSRVSRYGIWNHRLRNTLRAAVVFAAFEWLLWTATTVWTALRVLRGERTVTTGKPMNVTGPTVAV
ncbi:MAG: hypothetical protein M1826_002662 [Phylliscum demangeonii]|nr:MAG: hypothetical protein M1826_002662 [Phylliscum demangeonii]